MSSARSSRWCCATSSFVASTARGVSAEWDDILRDLNALTETTITYNDKSFAVRSNAVGVAGKIAQCVGVRLPNTVRQADVETERAEPSH